VDFLLILFLLVLVPGGLAQLTDDDADWPCTLGLSASRQRTVGGGGTDPPVTTRSGAIAGATASAPSSSARPRPSATRPSATWPRAWRPSALWV